MEIRRKPIVAWDLDDTLLKTLLALVVWHNRAYGTHFTIDDYVSDCFEDIWHVSNEEAVRRIAEFHASAEYKKVKPVEGAYGVLCELFLIAKEQHVATARPGRLRERTPQEVHDHFPSIFTAIHYANTYDLALPPRSKLEICREIGADFLIEDTHRHAHPCAEDGIIVCLVGQPWNMHITDLHPNIRRVGHIGEVPEIVRKWCL